MYFLYTGEPFSMELEKDSKKQRAESPPSSSTIRDNNEKQEIENTSKGEIESKASANVKMMERTGQKLGLSGEEIEELLIKTNQEREGEKFRDIEDDLELNLTLTQKLNLLIYGSFTIVTVYVLNRDYDSVVSHWFVTMFPREAKILGFQV